MILEGEKVARFDFLATPAGDVRPAVALSALLVARIVVCTSGIAVTILAPVDALRETVIPVLEKISVINF